MASYGLNSSGLLRQGPIAGFYEHDSEPSVSRKDERFLY
jgi:hypothetical protein